MKLNNPNIFDKDERIAEILDTYICPYCENGFTLTYMSANKISIDKNLELTGNGFNNGIKLERGGTFKVRINASSPSFSSHQTLNNDTPTEPKTIERTGFDLVTLKCPNPSCNGITIYINSYGKSFPQYRGQFLPNNKLTYVPDYVPEHIRKSIKEAELICELSPNASATLSRRSLQGMIRDFHDIKRANLHQEIVALEERISPDEYNALMGLKSLGNDAAHTNESDITSTIIEVDEDEARDLILIIHHFIKSWYIHRHDTNELLRRVTTAAASK